MRLEVMVPEEYVGDVISDLNKRRAEIKDTDFKAGLRVIRAFVPLAETFGYITDLRTISSGRASSTLEFSHYAPVPPDIQQLIIDTITGKIYFQNLN